MRPRPTRAGPRISRVLSGLVYWYCCIFLKIFTGLSSSLTSCEGAERGLFETFPARCSRCSTFVRASRWGNAVGVAANGRVTGHTKSGWSPRSSRPLFRPRAPAEPPPIRRRRIGRRQTVPGRRAPIRDWMGLRTPPPPRSRSRPQRRARQWLAFMRSRASFPQVSGSGAALEAGPGGAARPENAGVGSGQARFQRCGSANSTELPAGSRR